MTFSTADFTPDERSQVREMLDWYHRTQAPAPTPTPIPTPTPPPVPTPTPGALLSGAKAGFCGSYQVTSDSATDVARHLDLIVATGAKWVRANFYWSQLETSRGVFNWGPTDRLVAAVNARGLHLLATPAYTPSWARSGGDDKYPPLDMNDYVNFVMAAVRRYAPQGVKAWEVWNEPNIVAFWHPQPNPAQYASMLRMTHAAIHSVDATATVITGGTAPTGNALDSMGSDGKGYSPYRWLRLLYEGGNQAYFDAVGNHPYATFPYSPLESWGSAMWTSGMHDLMVAKGDGTKKIWGTEAGYPTGTSSGAVSETAQALYIHDYLTMWSRWDAWTGPLFLYQMKDRGTALSDRESNFGLLHYDWSKKPSYDRFDADVG